MFTVHRFYTHYVHVLPIALHFSCYATIYCNQWTGSGIMHAQSITLSITNTDRMLAFQLVLLPYLWNTTESLLHFHACVLLNMQIFFTSLLVVCSAKLRGHRQISCTEFGLLSGSLAISFEHSCFRRIIFIYFQQIHGTENLNP